MTKDLLSGFSVVKSFKAEAEVVARFCRRNEELEETKGHRRRMEEVITGHRIMRPAYRAVTIRGHYVPMEERTSRIKEFDL